MARLNKERQEKLEPKRVDYSYNALKEIEGVSIIKRTDTEVRFLWKGHMVKFYPYSGWHTGKSITDGRGFKNLIKQLQ